MENGKRETLVFHRMCQHHPNAGTCSASWGFKSVSPSGQREVSNRETPLIAGRWGRCEYPEGNRSSSRHYEIKGGGKRQVIPQVEGMEAFQGARTPAFRQVPGTPGADGGARGVCLSAAQVLSY